MLRLLVASPDHLSATGLAALAQEGGLDVVATLSGEEAVGCEDIIATAVARRADLILWRPDQARPDQEVVSQLAGDGRRLIVICRREAARSLLAQGARGVLNRRVTPARLRATARAVARGLVVMAPQFATSLAGAAAQRPGQPREPLSQRELEVLGLVANGLSNRAAGQRLGISEHTVKFHVATILGKLEVRSRTQAVSQAVRLGLLVL